MKTPLPSPLATCSAIGLAIALFLPASLAGAEQTSPRQRSSVATRHWSPDVLVAELRKGGYVLYFRHSSTDFSQNDERMKDYDDCANQRNLTDRGRTEAKAIGAAIRDLAIPFERVLASPFCRTVETARLAFGRADKMQEVRGGPAAPADTARYAALRQILDTRVPPGTNLAVVSHGNPFVSVAGPPYLAEGEAAVIRPLNGDFEVVSRIRLEDWEALRVSAGR